MKTYSELRLVLLVFIVFLSTYNAQQQSTKKPNVCVSVFSRTIRARHKSCFLRPDAGPCRADILQWYYDVKQMKCYRFYWGGCQGNGNRFESNQACSQYCFLNGTEKPPVPFFCSMSFDYGTCFGHYYRWSYDKDYKICKRRLYSGCGGNQNNFETYEQCFNICVDPPDNFLKGPAGRSMTTCIPAT